MDRPQSRSAARQPPADRCGRRYDRRGDGREARSHSSSLRAALARTSRPGDGVSFAAMGRRSVAMIRFHFSATLFALLALTGRPPSSAAQSLRGSLASVGRMYDHAVRDDLAFYETSNAVLW